MQTLPDMVYIFPVVQEDQDLPLEQTHNPERTTAATFMLLKKDENLLSTIVHTACGVLAPDSRVVDFA